MDKVAKQCMSPFLLLHKDPAVKAYLAACLADLLRLYAPEAPYTQAELKVSIPIGNDTLNWARSGIPSGGSAMVGLRSSGGGGKGGARLHAFSGVGVG